MVEPSISLEQTDIRVIKGQEGQTVDVKATLARIQPYFLVQQNGSVDLVVEKHIPTTVNVEETARLAEAILSQPFTIQAANPDVGQGPGCLSRKTWRH